MQLRDFSGGKNVRIAPHLLPVNTAQVYTNIDNSAGILRPIKGPLDMNIGINQYFTYYFKGAEWVSNNIPTNYIEYRDVLYSMDATGAYKYKSNVKHNLGIKGPTTKLSGLSNFSGFTLNTILGEAITVADNFKKVTETRIRLGDPISGAKWTLKNNSNLFGTWAFGANIPIVVNDAPIDTVVEEIAEVEEPIYNEYRYVYTYYNSIDGTESKPSPLSDPIKQIGSADITISGFVASSDPQVDKIRLYRIGGTLSNYSLVSELSNNSTVISTMDRNLDWDIAGNHVLDTTSNGTPVLGLKYLTLAYAMLFAAIEDKLYYSDIAKPDVWPATNFIDFDHDITGIGAVQNGLLVFTKFHTYIVTGNSPHTFSKYLLDGEQGCIDYRTIKFVDGSLLWVSTDGICSSNGGGVKVITRETLGKMTLNTIDSSIFDSVYYLAHTEGILAFDFRYNKIVRDISTVVSSLRVVNDTLYGNIDDRLVKVIEGNNNLSMNYKSPLLVFGKASEYKEVKDVYIAYRGQIHITIDIDGKVVLDKELDPLNNQANLKVKGNINGYGVTIQITGTGEVDEVDLNPKGRENGR